MLKYIDELKALNLPIGQYAIFGSGPMSVRNIRNSSDIDIIVKDDLWNKLKLHYSNNIKLAPDNVNQSINLGNIEIYYTWPNITKAVSDLIDDAEIINDLPFVKLEYVKEWKLNNGRDKDKQDVTLIDNYLASY